MAQVNPQLSIRSFGYYTIPECSRKGSENGSANGKRVSDKREALLGRGATTVETLYSTFGRPARASRILTSGYSKSCSFP